jgi:ABC-type transport system involved in multi-copper enzyme maturation permease subunit
VQGKAFRRLTMVFVVALVFYCVILYVVPDFLVRRVRGEAGPGEVLRTTVAAYVQVMSGLVPLLALFVGAGLVAEDLRTRALPLYLVRPITPADYWLGKLLIPVAVIGTSYVLPLLFLVLFGILLRPSDEILGFAAAQAGLAGAVVVHGLLAGATYGSLMLLVSTLAGRRLGALLLGAAVVYGSEMLRVTLGRQEMPGEEVWRALSLPADLKVIFHELADVPVRFAEWNPKVGPAVAAVSVVVAAGAVVVLRRARSVEVTS